MPTNLRFGPTLLAFAIGVAAVLGPGCSAAASPPPSGPTEVQPVESNPADASGPVEIAIVDPSPWHVHAPGTPFTIEVTATGQGIAGTYVHARWVDSKGQALSDPVKISADVGVTLTSPGADVGYYGLVFSSEGPNVAFPPQPTGFRSMEYGFAIMRPADAARTHDPESYFGSIQCFKEVDDRWDPYLRGHHAKTMTWLSSRAEWWDYEIERRATNGMSELPLVSGDVWDTDNDTPITEADLDALAALFEPLAAVSPDGLDWELGREENRSGRYDTAYYFPNLTAKVRRVREILATLPAPGRLVYNFEGFHLDDLEKLLSSDAIREFDVLALHPYRWKDFPSPESWFPGYMADVRQLLQDHSLGNMELWITETGIPVRGTTDPDGFFGYPDSGAEVPGATRDYAARYLVKLHVLAISEGVQRVYMYNYQNRGNDPAYAEHHFGLRSYNSASRTPGFPLPGYVACMTMLDELYRKRFEEARQPHADARVFEFAEGGASEATIVAWALPGTSVPLSWAALRPGLVLDNVIAVRDLYGTAQSMEDTGITLDDGPVWITFRVP